MNNLKRKAYHAIRAWKHRVNRKPLILRGARQVGKTHLLKMFAEHEFSDSLYLNFEKQESVRRLFEHDLDPEKILQNLALHLGKKISSETLLIFDEIQECEGALTSLKYFNEEYPQQPIACAGSLLGVKLNRDKGFPVGQVNFLDLYPLSFLEFLIATNKEQLATYLTELTPTASIAPSIHEQLLDLLKIYFIVGGMPEAVVQYCSNQDWQSIQEIQEAILDTYTHDFVKHTQPSEVMKVVDVWNSLPAQLAKENKKFKYSEIKKSARAREYTVALQWLFNAGLVLPTYCLSTIKLPLSGYAQNDIFKIYALDVGLLSAKSNLSPTILLKDNQLFSEFKGALTENFIAQALVHQFKKPLYYWSRNNRSEIDFILPYENNAIPLEVKSGKNVRSKSLSQYITAFNPNKSLRVSMLNLKQQDHVVNLPLYMADLIKSLLSS